MCDVVALNEIPEEDCLEILLVRLDTEPTIEVGDLRESAGLPVSFKGLLVDAVGEFDACAVIRGIRAVSDFEYEFQMALMNRELNEKCETLFMMPSPEYSYVSSRLIKEIARCGGNISPFVPPVVAAAIEKKYGKSSRK